MDAFAARPSTQAGQIYPGHCANIHERRWAARIARSVPLLLFLLVTAGALYGAFKYRPLLIVLCAVLNTSLWLYLVSSAVLAIWGCRRFQLQMQESEVPPKKVALVYDGDADCKQAPVPLAAHGPRCDEGGTLGASKDTAGSGSEPVLTETTTPTADVTEADASRSGRGTEVTPSSDCVPCVVHMIVLPNYKEDEEMLAQTLECLSEAEGADSFRIVLAMEEREGPEGVAKANRLEGRFSNKFAWVKTALHPRNLQEQHADGSSDPEVPGKASNLKYAVNEGYKLCEKEGALKLEQIVVTVADADCLFHPNYFSYISCDYMSEEFDQLRVDDKHFYTMWQAPQLPFRNFYLSPVCSRTWGYLASVDEIGGTTGLAYGGHHMVFSGYSLPLRLAVQAEPWDGDVVAEDHHAFLRCFFYSLYMSAEACANELEEKCVPPLQVRPVFLPVKSTSVASADGYLPSWVERYYQARRHMQGVSEFSYAILATWDTLLALPLHLYSWRLFSRTGRVLFKLFCVHMLPTLQSVCLGLLSILWLWNHKQVPQCPESIGMVDSRREMIMCGLAGAWVLVWPVIVPSAVFVVANYFFVVVAFLQPPTERASRGLAKTIWHSEDSGTPPTLGMAHLTVLIMVCIDISIFMVVLAIPYAMLPMILAYQHTCFHGNRIAYVTAAKLLRAKYAPNYGSISNGEKGEKIV